MTTEPRLLHIRWLVAIMAAASLFAVSGCSRSKEGDNVAQVSAEDAAMNAAIAKAKATSGDFIRAFHEQKSGTQDFHVKKPYPTPTGTVEHMWIEVTEETNGVLRGVVANEPDDTREVKMGQQVSLNISEISDWKYIDGKKLVGGYTIRYFYEKMSPKEKKKFLEETGFEM